MGSHLDTDTLSRTRATTTAGAVAVLTHSQSPERRWDARGYFIRLAGRLQYQGGYLE